MSRIPPCVVLASALCLSQQAHAEAVTTWTLSWESPRECLDEAAVREEVESLVAEPGSPGLNHVVAHGVVWRGESGEWHARVETESDGVAGERTLGGASCRAVTEAAILIIALSIDPASNGRRQASGAPLTAARQDRTASQEAVLPAPPSATLPARDAGEQQHAADSQGPVLSVELGTVFAVGVLPSAAQGLSAGVALLYESWRFRVSAAWWPEKHGAVESAPTKGGDIRLASLELAGGLAWSIRDIAVGPELGLIGGLLQGNGTGVRNPHAGEARWAAGTIGSRLAWNLSAALALEVRAGVLFSFYRQRFELDDIGLVHQPAAFGALGGLALAGRFR